MATIPLLSFFSSLWENEVYIIFCASHPTICPLDSTVSHLLQEISPTLLPAQIHIINIFLTTANFPPHLRRLGLPYCSKSQRWSHSSWKLQTSLSSANYVKNSWKKVVFNQFSAFLSQYNLFDNNQSGSKGDTPQRLPCWPLLKFFGWQEWSPNHLFLILLHLSVAFDTINPQSLLATPYCLGITGTPVASVLPHKQIF